MSFFPTREPIIRYIENRDIYRLEIYERIDSNKRRTLLTNYQGRQLKTQKNAEEVKNEIWGMRMAS